MANALIGALKVSLGIDSAQFEAGLRKAQLSLGSFGKVAAVGIAAAATAAVAAGAAMAVMGQKAINAADDMSKAAQKAGLTTEALSRLAFAGDFADVSLEQLTGGLQKLSNNMAAIASGKGGAAGTAFSALGISVTDAAGNLRDADAVFTDVADRFSRLENGSTKTALAIQIFGKSGADLIPLLNEGKVGLAEMADEADRLGLTISTETGRAAEEFNDEMTRVDRIIDGVAMRVAEAALPALKELANTLTSPRFVEGAKTLGTTVVTAINAIAAAAGNAGNNLRMLQDAFSSVQNMSSEGLSGRLADIGRQRVEFENSIIATQGKLDRGDDLFGINRGALEAQLTKTKADMDALIEQERVILAIIKEREDGQAAPATTATDAPSFDVPAFTDTAGAEALASKLQAFRESLMTEEQYEIESHAKRLEELQGFYEAGSILKGEYDTLLESAQQQHADRMSEIAREQVEEESRLREQLVSNVAGIFGSLSRLAETFGDKGLAAAKAFGVAEAIVNTAQGITKALAQGGVLGFAGAAAVAAAGAAQIATILSTNKGSSSIPSVGGSAGGTGSAAVAAPERRSVTLQLNGSPDDRASLRDIGSLVDRLNEELGINGLEIVTTYRGA